MRLLIDSLKIAVSSLLTKKIRSFLSILGIVIGILTIASLLSIALTVRNEVERQITNLGSNLVTVVPGDITTGNFTASLGTSTLTQQDYLDVRDQVENVKNVSLSMLISGTVRVGQTTLPAALVFATSPNLDKNLNFTIEKGRFVTEEDEETKARVVVLGSKAAKELFGTNDVLGKTLELRSTSFTVVGVLQEIETSLSFGGPDLNSSVILPISTGWELTNTQQVFRIMMQAEKPQVINQVKEQVNAVILNNHKGEQDFSVVTQEDLVSTVGGVLNLLTAMLGAIAGISLLVGGIGIMNIMLVSVSERTREIGIRKAVGATQGAILLQFLIEAVILTLVGGFIAVGIYSLVISLIPENSPIPLDFNWNVILLSLGFSALVGIVFGIIPAIGAAHKDPIQSLKYE